MVEQLQLVLSEPHASERRIPARVGAIERATFQHRLEETLGREIHRLTLTDNRVTMFSSKAHLDGRFELRIHAAFIDASDAVLEDVARCSVRGVKRDLRAASLERVRAFFDTLDLPEKERRVAELDPQGEFFDLQDSFDRMNERYFDSEVQASVGWSQGRRSRRRRRRRVTVQLGSYVYEDHRIRIHPMLDAADVPLLVVDAVMHHEMV
ncbi:MAG: hypothetical protein AAF690_24915, partial [Acidobacteriota bacterium]